MNNEEINKLNNEINSLQRKLLEYSNSIKALKLKRRTLIKKQIKSIQEDDRFNHISFSRPISVRNMSDFNHISGGGTDIHKEVDGLFELLSFDEIEKIIPFRIYFTNDWNDKLAISNGDDIRFLQKRGLTERLFFNDELDLKLSLYNEEVYPDLDYIINKYGWKDDLNVKR